MPVVDGQVIDLLTLTLGEHTFTVTAVDMAWNEATKSVTFTVRATATSLKALVNELYASGDITRAGIRTSLLAKLSSAQKLIMVGRDSAAINKLSAFIAQVRAQSGKTISPAAAALLIADADWLIDSLR